MANFAQILVVDDDHDTTITSVILLQQMGFDAQGCSHAKDCMEAIERLRPAVVLLDLGMPGMDGFDIAEELQDNPDLRPKLLIAVTGYGQERDRKATSAAGFDYHLIKPLEWKDLEPLLRAACPPSETARSSRPPIASAPVAP